MEEKTLFTLKKYLRFALRAELVFILIIAVIATITTVFFKENPQVVNFVQSLMKDLMKKVGDTVSSKLMAKIFLNNFLITLVPLVIFSFQVLPIKPIKSFFVWLSAGVGLFLYLMNAITAGLTIGIIGVHSQVGYGVILLITLIHGSLELFAMAAGTCLGGYVLFHTYQQEKQMRKRSFVMFTVQAQNLILNLVPVLTVVLLAAALIEVYISAPIARILLK